MTSFFSRVSSVTTALPVSLLNRFLKNWKILKPSLPSNSISAETCPEIKLVIIEIFSSETAVLFSSAPLLTDASLSLRDGFKLLSEDLIDSFEPCVLLIVTLIEESGLTTCGLGLTGWAGGDVVVSSSTFSSDSSLLFPSLISNLSTPSIL